MLTRLLAVALAVVACAWFVLGARQAHDLNRATALLNGPGSVSPASARVIQGLLTGAGTLNPDRQVEIERGLLAAARHQPQRALAILEHVVAQEPMNVVAWVFLGENSAGHIAVFSRALRHITKLDPPQPQARG